MDWGALAALGGAVAAGGDEPRPQLLAGGAAGAGAATQEWRWGRPWVWGVGAVCFAMLAASGWQRQIAPEWLQAVRLAGAAFLCWLGYRMWRGAGVAAPASARTAGVLTLWQGVAGGVAGPVIQPQDAAGVCRGLCRALARGVAAGGALAGSAGSLAGGSGLVCLGSVRFFFCQSAAGVSAPAGYR